MSITSEIRASARTTYRLLFRTAANTFRGDDRVLNAFREKVRNEFREGRSLTDASAYSARIKLGQEVADVLKNNIVQGVKADQAVNDAQRGPMVKDESGVWRLRITKDTELGSNESTKLSSQPAQTSGRRQSCCQSLASPDLLSETNSARFEDGAQIDEDGRKNTPQGADSESDPQRKRPNMNYSALKRASQKRLKPELNENDLKETFVRGSGPGGQSINKTENNVQLLHKPTGIRVTCQETRSLQSNRMIARKNLLERLDQIANPGLSKEDMKRAKQIERERRRRKKAKKKARAKATVDVNEGSD